MIIMDVGFTVALLTIVGLTLLLLLSWDTSYSEEERKEVR